MEGQGSAAALVEFSFTSRATENLPPAARLRIARQAWLYNSRWGLTGELRFERGCFRQVIEGACEVVLPLASRILTDPRHGDIAVGAFRSIAVRRFAGWTAFGFEAPGLVIPNGTEVQALRALALPVDGAVPSIVPAHMSMG
jgi:hypothetical protein